MVRSNPSRAFPEIGDRTNVRPLVRASLFSLGARRHGTAARIRTFVTGHSSRRVVSGGRLGRDRFGRVSGEAGRVSIVSWRAGPRGRTGLRSALYPACPRTESAKSRSEYRGAV